MSPERMLLYVTDASPCCDSTSAGFPESMEQVPRATPGLEAGSVVGSLESSQTWVPMSAGKTVSLQQHIERA